MTGIASLTDAEGPMGAIEGSCGGLTGIERSTGATEGGGAEGLAGVAEGSTGATEGIFVAEEKILREAPYDGEPKNAQYISRLIEKYESPSW